MSKYILLALALTANTAMAFDDEYVEPSRPFNSQNVAVQQQYIEREKQATYSTLTENETYNHSQQQLFNIQLKLNQLNQSLNREGYGK